MCHFVRARVVMIDFSGVFVFMWMYSWIILCEWMSSWLIWPVCLFSVGCFHGSFFFRVDVFMVDLAGVFSWFILLESMWPECFFPGDVFMVHFVGVAFSLLTRLECLFSCECFHGSFC